MAAGSSGVKSLGIPAKTVLKCYKCKTKIAVCEEKDRPAHLRTIIVDTAENLVSSSPDDYYLSRGGAILQHMNCITCQEPTIPLGWKYVDVPKLTNAAPKHTNAAPKYAKSSRKGKHSESIQIEKPMKLIQKGACILFVDRLVYCRGERIGKAMPTPPPDVPMATGMGRLPGNDQTPTSSFYSCRQCHGFIASSSDSTIAKEAKQIIVKNPINLKTGGRRTYHFAATVEYVHCNRCNMLLGEKLVQTETYGACESEYPYLNLIKLLFWNGHEMVDAEKVLTFDEPKRE